MIPLAKRLHFGATMGIVSMIIVNMASFGSGSFYMTVVANPEVINDRIDITWNIKLFAFLYFLSRILGPCLLVFLLLAVRDWMQYQQTVIGEGLFYIGLLGLGLWTVSGSVAASLLPGTPLIFDDPAQQENTLLFLRSFSGGLLDAAYWVMAMYGLPVAWFAWQQNLRFLGGVGLFINLSMLAIAPLGPFQELNILGFYGYGIPLMFLFVLSVSLLYVDMPEKNDILSRG